MRSLRWLDFDEFEVFLARTAFRAHPIDGNIFPAGTCSEAFFWKTLSFVIDESAD